MITNKHDFVEMNRNFSSNLNVCGWVVSQKSSFYYSKTTICDDVVFHLFQEAWEMFSGSPRNASGEPGTCFREAQEMLSGSPRSVSGSLGEQEPWRACNCSAPIAAITIQEAWEMLLGSPANATAPLPHPPWKGSNFQY